MFVVYKGGRSKNAKAMKSNIEALHTQNKELQQLCVLWHLHPRVSMSHGQSRARVCLIV